MTATQIRVPAATFRDVLAVREWRALWLAQVISIAGDQFAAVALAALIYGRTRSPLLAAAVFAATTGAMAVSGLLLAWTADAYPRRAVMLACDLACAGLVLFMLIPGLPLWTLIVLLAAVSLALEPFLSARMAVNAEVLGENLFALGQSVTIATYQAAQFAGFALGGLVTGVLGVRAALAVDAASFAVSAGLIRSGVMARPAAGGGSRPPVLAGIRVVWGSPVARLALALMCMAGFFAAPAGAIIPLGASLGGPGSAGLLLGAVFAGGTIGPLAYTRLLGARRRTAGAAVMATAACSVLTLFTFMPPLGAAAFILAVSGACSGFIPAAGAALLAAIQPADHGKAGGVIGAAMSMAQGTLILAAGAAAQRVSPAIAIALCGMTGTIAGLPLILAWRRLSPAGRAVPDSNREPDG